MATRSLSRSVPVAALLLLPALTPAAHNAHAVGGPKAAASWKVVKSPNPLGLYNGVLNGIACPAATECIGVGDGSTTGSTLGTLIQNWNGTAWSPVASPNPTGADAAYPQLNAVSCPTATACTAVGTTLLTSNDSVSLVEQMTSTSKKATWSVVASPDLSGASSTVLTAVSCPDTTTCFAVGWSRVPSSSFVPDLVTTVEEWTAASKAWTVKTSPNPTDALQSRLNGVSCLTATNCVAVGFGLTSSSTTAFSETWDGSTWSLVTVTPPSGAADTELQAINCQTASGTIACFAAGRTYATEFSAPESLVEVWNGSSWSPMTTRDASGVVDNILFGISCQSTTTCTAVGESDLNNSGGRQTLVEQLAAGTWSLEASQNASGGSSSLAAVACSGSRSTTCEALGQSYTPDEDHPLTESAASGSWKLVPPGSPRAPSGSYLNAVSCSGVDCSAVGYHFPANSFNTVPLVVRTTGQSWALDRVAAPAGALRSDLLGVACPGPTSCIAVGDEVTDTSQDSSVLVESLTGSSWSTVATPAVTGAATSELTSISCTSTTRCVAVGWSAASVGGPKSVLVEQLSSSTWSIATTPAVPGAATSELTGVSCVSTSICDAVGSEAASGSPSQSLVEQMSGAKWVVRRSPPVTGGASAQLRSVACLATKTATTCEAVGWTESASFQVSAYATQGRGATWSVVPAAGAPSSYGTVLQSVSCTAVGSCAAGGYGYLDAGGDTTLVESWNGHAWSAVASGSVSGNYSTGLNGMSCGTGATAVCVAAGSGDNGFGGTGTLIEKS
jgi:hypothetical protein